MGEQVLVVNTGSSSLKYELFDMDGPRSVLRGIVERIGEPGSPIADHATAFRFVAQALADGGRAFDGLRAIGHRVVHGGETFVHPTRIDGSVIDEIRRLIPLAPLHNPANLVGIEAAMELFPGVPHVAVFDTAFHRTLPPAAYLYALPYERYTDDGIRRYGFHGTSHEYVARQAAVFLGREFEATNTITLHLGNGASATAVQAGRSVETSMGLGPLEGLVMGTRSGDVDATIVFHLARAGWSLADVEAMLNSASGLKGLCGHNDMREVIRLAEQGDRQAQVALDVTVHRLRKYVGAYYAVLGRVDALVFTAGIGENNALVRRRTCAGLERLGIVLDDAANEAPGRDTRAIHASSSDVAVLVVPTDEERAIAEQTYAVALEG
jgi:acetate kinase